MTAKRPNKPRRLSKAKNSGNFCTSDYNSSPLIVKTVGGVLILPPATLAQADTPTQKPWRSDQGGLRKKSAGPRRTRPDRLRPCMDLDHPHDGPQKLPDRSTGGRICKPHRHGNGPQRATGNAIRPRKRDGDGTQRHRKAKGRKKNKDG